MTVTPAERTARPATCQMFETPLIERFSRIHPIVPFAFWLPVLGLFLWTFAEYVLHRYVFHYVGPRLWQRRMHFVLHGVHHDFAQDADRLVMPLGASIPMGVAFY